MTKKNLERKGILDLFCGSGGLSLGFLAEGFEVIMSNDIEEDCIQTIKANHEKIAKALGKKNGHGAEAKDIHELTIAEIKREFKRKRKEVFGILGGPPCKGFSMANMQTRFIDNPFNHLFKEFVRIVKGLKPEFFVFENVVGLLSMANGKVAEEILKTLKDLGYSVDTKVLTASDFGVPQNRKRVIIIGYKGKREVTFPEPTHGDSPGLKPIVTVERAIMDLPKLKSGEYIHGEPYKEFINGGSYSQVINKSLGLQIKPQLLLNHITTRNSSLVIERYKHIPQGGNWRDVPEKLFADYTNKESCHSSIYRRLELEKPSITVSNFRKSMFVHPTQDRGLSVREAARLQSFPDWYEFKGKINNQQQQIADAVPPLMARAVAKHIKETLSK